MYDFGDSLLFLAVFVAAALPATAAALFFLRPHRSFWLALCVVVPAVAITALVALIEYLGAKGDARVLPRGAEAHSPTSHAGLRGRGNAGAGVGTAVGRVQRCGAAQGGAR